MTLEGLSQKQKPSRLLGQPSMRRLPLSTENFTASTVFLLLRLHISASARDAAAVQAARGLARRKGSLDGRCVPCD